MAEREILCHGCRKHVPISTLRYDISGKRLMCGDCRGVEKQEQEEQRIKPLVTGPFGQPKSHKYQCTDCRYSFRRTSTTAVRKCPNCASVKMIKFEKLSADDLLKMADDDRFKGL